jgi:Pvc16 N-terminal domain/Carboxypeptidase regulatory-like domain
MIRDLSETLRAMLDDPALASTYPELAAAQILFDQPTEQFKPSQTTINLFLYDVRENLELRSNEPLFERRDGEVIIRPAATRLDCSYLITAWPVGGSELALQEHRLLSQAYAVLTSRATIPPAYLRGRLAGQTPPLPAVAAPAEGLKNPAEFWGALGSKLRPSLNLTVTISMDALPAVTAREVTAAEIRFGERAAPDAEALKETSLDTFRIGGRVTDAADAAVAGARVNVEGLGVNAVTDAEGRFELGPLSPGTHTLSVRAGSTAGSKEITVPATAGADFNVKLTG